MYIIRKSIWYLTKYNIYVKKQQFVIWRRTYMLALEQAKVLSNSCYFLYSIVCLKVVIIDLSYILKFDDL